MESHRDGPGGFAVEPLPPGAIGPRPWKPTCSTPRKCAPRWPRCLSSLRVKGQDVALLVPDPVIRVFVLHFDVFPRSTAEAIPLLRWRLKKSVPFEAEETLISFMRQAPREEGVDIVTGLGAPAHRSRVRAAGGIGRHDAGRGDEFHAGGHSACWTTARPVLLARVAGKSLTTAIVREGILCGYRCIELPAEKPELTPQALLDEIYPLAAYYQDSWSEGIAFRAPGRAGRPHRGVS